MQFAREGISALLAIILATAPVTSYAAEETHQEPKIRGVSVSGEVPLRYGGVTINGYAIPNALILVFWRGTVIGTTTANAKGAFVITVQGLPQAKNDISIGAVDSLGNASGASVISPLIPVEQITTSSGVLVPPTVESITAKRWLSGELSGFTPLGTTLSIQIDGKPIIADIIVAADGAWTYLIPAKYRAGKVNIEVVARDAGGNTSAATKVPFTILPSGDVDQNGTVDTDDLSQMMNFFSWNIPLDDPREIDGVQPISSSDIKTLLGQWTGIWK